MLKWVLILAGLLASVAHAKSAAWNCSTSGYVETCNSYLDPKGFSVTATTSPNSQQQANWCWLASIEMAFRYYGYAVPQKTLLELLWGNIEDMPGRPEQIIGATNRVYIDDNGKRFRAESVQKTSWLDAAVGVSKDMPILLGYSQPGGVGHMTMVVGIQYQAFYNASGQVIDSKVSEVVVWDPWPGVGLRNLTQTEFDNTFTLVGVGATGLESVSLMNRPRTAKPVFFFHYDLAGRRLLNGEAVRGFKSPALHR